MSGLRTSWQTLLADLALVLFIITAAALGRVRFEHRLPPAPSSAIALADPSIRASAIAVYRDGPGAPDLATWLKQQAPDARQQVTIVMHYRPEVAATVPARIADMLAAARTAGTQARIVIEPGIGGTSAGIGFDPPADDVARPLPRAAQDSPGRTTP